MPLYFDDVIIYIEKPRDSTDELFEQIREFTEVSGYEKTIEYEKCSNICN